MQQTTRLVLWKNIALTAGILAATTCLCLLLRRIDGAGAYASELFLLAVFLISRFTTGYLWGVVASLLSVLAVNFLFTYPYYAFNFTISGYPLTMLCMLAVSIITGAMTTQIKRQGDLRIEAEREKTRGNLLRAVSHDLRTPLTSILGASSAILENDDRLSEEERLRLVRDIRNDSQWLIRMVENLLTITRMDDGGRPAGIYKRPEAAEELASAAVVRLKKRFPDRSVRVKVPDALLIVPMDAMLVEQVLLNLLENAVIHGRGATRIELTVSAEGSNAVFEVRDNGCGIDPAVLPRLFEGVVSTREEDPGDSKRSMGIGLSVCNTIIRAHAGRMWAENLPGGGAAVRFSLPLEETRS